MARITMGWGIVYFCGYGIDVAAFCGYIILMTTTEAIAADQAKAAEIEARMDRAVRDGDADAYHRALAERSAMGAVAIGYDEAEDLVIYK